MRTPNFVKLSIIIFLFVSVFAGCKKDEMQTTGNVRISFVNHPTDLTVIISPVENVTIPIYTKLNPFSGDLVTELNAGNYILYCQSTSAYPSIYETPGFQVRAGQTTTIAFDGNNIAHVQ